MSLVAMSGRLTLASLLAVSSATAQESQAAQSSPTISGFAEAVIPAQRAFEQTLLDAIQPDSVGRWARTLAMRPHVAGTQGQVATRDSVIGWHMAAGIDAGYDSLMLYMPHPLLVSVERTWPEPMVFDLAEPPIAGDPATGLDVVPVFNAYSGSGVAAAEVVFAGYGLPADYRTLDSAGVSVEGKVVLARYGRSFRGIKAREAEARGAVGLLLYSDPENDGFVRGEVYPDGPMRPARGVQRGSVLNATGDPSTPTVPSLLGAPRVPEEQMVGVARIPVVPIGYEAAEALLQPLGGPEAPESWQGGLDLTYRFGPGPTRARVEVRTESGEAAYHSAYNTIAVVDGADWPDEWVVIGAHRDAWSPGAIDNASGTASVVEVARAFGAAAALGMRPRRTVVFATWDAEEWGIIGSIEWVEAHAERLRASVVAYVNQDAPVSGSSFGAASSPELKSLAREVARRVDDPARAGTVTRVSINTSAFRRWVLASVGPVVYTTPCTTRPAGCRSTGIPATCTTLLPRESRPSWFPVSRMRTSCPTTSSNWQRWFGSERIISRARWSRRSWRPRPRSMQWEMRRWRCNRTRRSAERCARRFRVSGRQ
jgi:N-acetylated-alpha-linked acidic dipeptidase